MKLLIEGVGELDPFAYPTAQTPMPDLLAQFAKGFGIVRWESLPDLNPNDPDLDGTTLRPYLVNFARVNNLLLITGEYTKDRFFASVGDVASPARITRLSKVSESHAALTVLLELAPNKISLEPWGVDAKSQFLFGDDAKIAQVDHPNTPYEAAFIAKSQDPQDFSSFPAWLEDVKKVWADEFQLDQSQYQGDWETDFKHDYLQDLTPRQAVDAYLELGEK